MISHVLERTLVEIDWYLETFPTVYTGARRDHIVGLVKITRAVVAELVAPGGDREPR